MITYRIESINHKNMPPQTGLSLYQAAKYLHLTEGTVVEKATFHEAVRGAWYVYVEEPDAAPVSTPKEQRIKAGFSEDEWNDFCEEWYFACLRLAPFAEHEVKWLGGIK